MKLCPNCHKLSKDDDFCSHCGSAVYGNDDYSENSKISCSNYSDHSHEKQTFSQSSYSRPSVNGSSMRDHTRRSEERNKKSKPHSGGWFVSVVIFIIVMNIITSMDMDMLMQLFEELFDL